MSRAERVLVHLANLLVAATGSVYGVMRYLMEPADEWAVVNHPWQPHVQHLHVLVAPLLVFAAGLVWARHVRPKLAAGANSRGWGSGLGLLTFLIPMVASGYLLQVAVEPGWRAAWTWIHVATSLLWVLAFVAHWGRSPDRTPVTSANASTAEPATLTGTGASEP